LPPLGHRRGSLSASRAPRREPCQPRGGSLGHAGRSAYGQAWLTNWPLLPLSSLQVPDRVFQVCWSARRDVSPGEQVRILLAAIDPALPPALGAGDREAIEAAYASPVLAHPPVLSPGVVDGVRLLAGRGLTLGVISNTGRTPGTMLRRLLARAGIAGCLQVLSFSDEVGVRKPDAAIFLRTLAAAGVSPGAALHVGDDGEADVGGARAVGMRAVHYLPGGSPGGVPADAVMRHFDELPEVLARLG
jgi:FMN phosphatase YigB (HAD superfamily)